MNLQQSHASFVLSLLLASLVPCRAEILIVNADGMGQYPTIQAAVDAAAEGDEVHLTDGVFMGDGNEAISFRGKAITIRSQDLDPSSAFVCSFIFDSNEGPLSVIQAVTFGWPGSCDSHRGIRCIGTSPTIRDCTFDGNEGPLFTNTAVGAPTLDGCRFINNFGGWDGGVIVWVVNGLVTRCLFQDNSAKNWAGGLYSGGSVIEDCIFIGNSAGHGGGAIDGGGTIRRCLFIENQQAVSIIGNSTMESCTFVGNDVYAVLVKGGSLSIANSILAFNIQISGPPIQGAPTGLVCTDIFGNVGGDWVGDIAQYLGQNGNISADPLFCNPDAGNYFLFSNSPCAPANSNGCDLIGAYDVDCDPSSVEAKSWGGIKGTYR